MTKLEFIKAVTSLISLASGKNTADASALLATLSKELDAFDPDFRQRQAGMLAKIQSQYQLAGGQRAMVVPAASSYPVDEFVKAIKPGISVVTCCMNRSENLLKAIASWVACPQINEIIIVDWNSTIPFGDELAAAGIHDERILIARVNDQPRWILSYAFNLGFRLASYDKILKTDADIIIRPAFFEDNELRESTFLSGDWRIAEKGQEHINGFFFIRRADLMKVKGFNEYITTYGWDDDDIYFRLEQQGFNRVRINPRGIYHIPHDDAQRVDAVATKRSALEELRGEPFVKIMGNRFLAAAMPIWDERKYFVQFRISLEAGRYLELYQSEQSWYQVPAHIQKDVEYYGMCAVLSWTTDLNAYSISKENMFALLSARKLRADVTRMDVRLACSSLEPVNWHRHVVVLYFADRLSLAARVEFTRRMSERANTGGFSVFVDAEVFDEIGASATGGIQTLLPIPPGFHVFDLTECAPAALTDLSRTFASLPAFWTKLDADQMARIGAELASAAPARRDRLYIHVQHGLGNRLRALASATAVAQGSNRELILIWEPDNHCECLVGDLFEYEGTVWTSAATIDFGKVDYFTYMELEEGACKDQYIPLTKGRDVYIRSAYVLNNELSNWERENEVLRQLRPVEQVRRLLETNDCNGRVGLHVRMEGTATTDHNSYDGAHNWLPESHEQLNQWREKSHYSRFIERIETLIRATPDLQLYLAADTPEAYHVFRERFGDRLAYLERHAFDRSKAQLIYALADAILLSRCNYLLGSTWSSFSELAQRFSTSISRIEMSGTDF